MNLPDSRFKKTARPHGTGSWNFPSRPFLLGCVWMSICLGAGSSALGFESFDQFEKSKKQQSLPLRVDALPGKDKVRPGDTFLLYVVAVLDKGWHLYSLEKQTEDETVATRIDLETTEFPPEGSWRETPPQMIRDEVMQRTMKTHSGRVEFFRQLSVPEGLKPGMYPLAGTLRFRACDNRICTLPQQVRFQTHVIVEADEPG